MATFEMVKYHSQSYPADIPLRIEECAAHFDVAAVRSELKRSLHTEYSYGKRKFDSALIQQFPAIISAQKDGVPQLWKDEQWAAEFARFLFCLSGNDMPEIVEIHPPFKDYTDWDGFVRSYRIFEGLILERFPNVCLLIENRCGSIYHGGRFLLSKSQDVETLCDLIVQNNLKLKIAYDIPQIYTAHSTKKQSEYLDLLQQAMAYRSLIGGVHLWGKSKSASGRIVAHCGNLTTYFDGNVITKSLFLEEFNKLFDDGICRKMVLEVNSGNADMLSIIVDLRIGGVSFV